MRQEVRSLGKASFGSSTPGAGNRSGVGFLVELDRSPEVFSIAQYFYRRAGFRCWFRSGASPAKIHGSFLKDGR